MPTVKLHQMFDLPSDIDWFELRGKITSWASQVLDALIVANAWSTFFPLIVTLTDGLDAHFPAISHPYWTVFILLCICLKPGIILRPLQWTGRAPRYICLLTWRFIAWPFKALNRFILHILSFVRDDVERGTYLSDLQSSSSLTHPRFIRVASPVRLLWCHWLCAGGACALTIPIIWCHRQ